VAVEGNARSALIRAGSRRVLADGEIVVERGEVSQQVYAVVVGSLAVLARSGIRVGRVGAGEVVGEVAAVTGGERTATLVADGPAELVVVEREAFEAWLDAHPDESARVTAAARRRLHDTGLADIAARVLGEDVAAALVPELLDTVTWIDLPAGATLFREGDVPDAAAFVLEGRLEVSRRGADGTSEVIGTIGRGEVVGETAILLRTTRTATVTAVRDTTLANVRLDVFESLLERHPTLTLQIARRMVARVAGGRPDPSSRGATVVALVVTPDAAARWHCDPGFAAGFAAEFVAEIERHASCATTTAAAVDAQLGRDGIASVAADDVRATRVTHHLGELEARHRTVVHLVDGSAPDGWARRVVQRADRVVLVASGEPSATELAQLGSHLDLMASSAVPRWLVLVHRPAARPVGASGLTIRSRVDEVHHVVAGTPADAARVARLAVGLGTGLVLGGGGARGYAHLGVLRALREQGVPVDRVIGASMGSIFAAGAALYRDLDELERVCAAQFERLLDYTVPIVALLKAKRITANLERVFGGLDAGDLWLPFACVSTNLTRSRLEVHRRGDLVTAIRASIAIPGVLPPVPFGEDLLVDGGVLDNVPADVMRADPSIGTVIAVDVAPDRGPATEVDYGMYVSGWQAVRNAVRRRQTPAYPGVGQVLVRTMITGSEGRRAAFRTDGTVDLYLDLEMHGVGLLEFDKFRPTVEQGYRLASPRIAEWLGQRSPIT
jgi:predicted acylesterase/phospholipase RssA/CRP-like cAMP-binding protein